MTEYELVDTFYTIAELSDQLIVSFISLLFAFLVASYLVSAKLDRQMAALVLVPYSFMALRYIAIYYNVSDDLMTLAVTINELRMQPTSSMGWLEIGGGMSIMFFGTAAAMLLSFVASIVFFFYMRKRQVE